MSDDEYPLFESGRTMSIRKRPLAIIAVVVVAVVVTLLATTIYFANRKNEGGKSAPITDHSSLPCPYKYFNVTDGINIRWYPNAHDHASLGEALNGSYHMIGAEVKGTGGGPLVGATALEEWLAMVMKHKVGIKLSMPDDKDLEANSAVIQTLDVLKHLRPLNRPIYIYANIVSVTAAKDHVNRTNFFAAVNQMLPEVRLSLGIVSGDPQQSLTVADVETFANIIKPLNQAVIMEADPVLVNNSWSVLRPWLANSRTSGIILTPGPNSTLTEYDLLRMRNDCDDYQLMYNMNLHSTLLKKFLQLSVTAESPMLAYGIQPRDASRIIWKHAVDDMALLNATLDDSSILMLEADIRMGNETGTNNTNIPIMQHDADKTSDLTFENFIKRVIPSRKGMKLDFKDLASVSPALNMTKEMATTITAPVWVNADILKGPGGGDVTMTASTFLEDAKLFPPVILSLGWTTGNTQTEKYTTKMVTAMNDLCKNLAQPVTFPIRAMIARRSLDTLNWLLQQSRGYTLTIWTAKGDNVTRDDMNFVQRQTEAARVYFDLPKELMPDVYL